MRFGFVGGELGNVHLRHHGCSMKRTGIGRNLNQELTLDIVWDEAGHGGVTVRSGCGPLDKCAAGKRPTGPETRKLENYLGARHQFTLIVANFDFDGGARAWFDAVFASVAF